MNEIVSKYIGNFDGAINHLQKELSGVRSGRAFPALVEHLKIEAYGVFTPLVELASITAPEPRLIVVSPWDKSIIKDVEKALQAANLGTNPTVDGTVIRLNFPPLTEDRRKELVKVVTQKLEEAKVAVRGIREDALKMLKIAKSDGSLAEDGFFAAQKELQKIVDDKNDQIKNMGSQKEQEIMTI